MNWVNNYQYDAGRAQKRVYFRFLLHLRRLEKEDFLSMLLRKFPTKKWWILVAKKRVKWHLPKMVDNFFCDIPNKMSETFVALLFFQIISKIFKVVHE